MTDPFIEPELGVKTTQMIGRESELIRLDTYLHDRNASHFCYYRGVGGLGKTRLLLEVQRLVRDAGAGFYSTDIVDLYHTDLHSISDIERAIMDGLDPGGKHFGNYRPKRQEYEQLRDRGAAEAALEALRAELPALFRDDFNQLSSRARKVVLCFDTIELLHDESTAVQDLPGLEDLDVRVRPWLMRRLGELRNVLVVFAGRPAVAAADPRPNAQERLIADMRAAFGEDLDVVELKPFTQEETAAFLQAIQPPTEQEPLIPAPLVPVVSVLAGGQPILLHLIVDLLYHLSPEPQAILDRFARYACTLGEAPDAVQLDAARKEIEKQVIDGIFDIRSEFGRYLQLIALMPKGVNAEILQLTLGLSAQEARDLLDKLEPLSFVKTFPALPGTPRLHTDRVFLHDEMYRLIRLSEVVPDLAINERMVVSRLFDQYYSPQIKALQDEIEKAQGSQERATLRERMRKLQTESLYYLLAWDPASGYKLYRSLSQEANRRREVGFAMRLLDELLRFYHTTRGRQSFEQIGLSDEQIVRDDARMWAERLNWWGRRDRLLRFARHILDHPEVVHLRRDQDRCALAHIAALWGRAVAIVEGYDISIAEGLREYLDPLPPLTESSTDEALARARLLVTIGWHYQEAGMLTQATEYYTAGRAAFKATGGYEDEYALTLNNLAYLHAQFGRFLQARGLAHEALAIALAQGNPYVEGLTRSTLAGIAMYRSSYDRAFRYGEAALQLFQEIGDPHGESTVHRTLAQAYRWAGTHEAKKGFDYALALDYLGQAQSHIDAARKLHLRERQLAAQEALIHRAVGETLLRQVGINEALPELRQAEQQLQALLAPGLDHALSPFERANLLDSLARAQYAMRDIAGTQETLRKLEGLFGPDYLIVPGEHLPPETVTDAAFHPLCKAEWLRLEMALAAGQIEQAVSHLALAYAYASYYSPQVVLIQFILDDLHTDYLSRASVADRARFMELVRRETAQDFGVPMAPLIETLQDLA